MGLVKLRPVSDEEFQDCNPLNRELMEDFLSNSMQLSDRTLQSYRSNLRIWLVWIKDNLNNKNITEIKPREYLRFQNWLVNRGCSSSDIRTKRSSISSLNNYIEVYYLDEYPNFRSCINSSIAVPEKVRIHEKNPPTRAEVEMMCNVVEESDHPFKYMIIAYIKFSFETGCRRAEIAQLKKSIVNAEHVVKDIEIKHDDGTSVIKQSSYYLTPKLRCKGRGKTGKIRQLKFSDYSMNAIKKWIDVRGDDDIDDLFLMLNQKEKMPASVSTFNDICTNILTPILGRRMHPHLLRSAAATAAVVEDGHRIESVQALLGHSSSSVTYGYVCGLDQESDADELFI